MSKALGRSVIRRVFLWTIWLFLVPSVSHSPLELNRCPSWMREVMTSWFNSLWITSLSSAKMERRHIPQGIQRWTESRIVKVSPKCSYTFSPQGGANTLRKCRTALICLGWNSYSRSLPDPAPLYLLYALAPFTSNGLSAYGDEECLGLKRGN